LEEKISKILQEDNEIEIITPFVNENSYYITGRIKVKHKGVELDFDVNVPYNYPLTHPNTDNISIVFRNTDLIGISHINSDGSVCFHPNKDDDFERKFKNEIIGLKTWIFEYYICRKEDNNYTYLIHNSVGTKFPTLLFSDNDKKFKKGDFGVFSYSNFSNHIIPIKDDDKSSVQVQTFYRIGFDKEFEDKWSLHFKNLLKQKPNKGFWIYIESEPITEEENKRKSIENWSQFEKYFTTEFIKYLYDSFKNLSNAFFFDNELFILVGYKIPNTEGYEIHWDLVRIPKNKLPIESILIPQEERTAKTNIYKGVCKSDLIHWGNTVNANYERFFGRGKLSEKLRDSKILIIGCGALGSSLAEILVRGGCKSIILEDFDFVKSGNICRSKYNLRDVNLRKIDALKDHLYTISPYVNIYLVPLKMTFYSDLEKRLNETVDYIFDCSTDPEITYFLDNLNYNGKIFSLSITNKAKNLICVSGKDITKMAKNIYDFVGNELPTFFEGTGCGYPTFEANFNEINTLLNVAFENINYQIETDTITDNFIIGKRIENSLIKPYIDTYKVFTEPKTHNLLYLSANSLTKVKDELIKHYPNEFGGVFIGFKNDDVIFISDILIPDKYENGRTVFVRHPGSLNEQLSLIFNESQGKISYIGDWHSHPNAPATPSSTDLVAIKEIADSKNVNNSSPILMIIEISKEKFEPKIYIYKDDKLLNYE